MAIKTIRSIREISPETWNAIANPPDRVFHPFLDHAFLGALELSKSAVPRTGWRTQHLVLENEQGKVLGLMPCYEKTHSQGEYVFDYSWAEAYRRAGGRYYPKIQVSIPFTPVTGPRLLVVSDPAQQHYRNQLLQGAVELCHSRNASSVHMTFLPENEWHTAGKMEFLQRTDIQFHWINDGYASFDDFLDTLASAKRKNIRKERVAVHAYGLQFEWLTGPDIKEHHWDAFFAFYMDTGSRKWGSPYLNRDFFYRIGDTMSRHILLVLCRRGSQYIAGALNFIGGDTLYGRNWGAIEDHPFLHFEACYYQAIEFAITRKLKRVEAGAQGPHKLARGYLPTTTYSAHYFADPRLGKAVEAYLRHERQAVAEDKSELSEHAPFRKQP